MPERLDFALTGGGCLGVAAGRQVTVAGVYAAVAGATVDHALSAAGVYAA